jgi:hypothetical protein
MIGMNRRQVLLAVIIAPALKSRTMPLTPDAFPWAVDRSGYITRRVVTRLRSENETVINLTPLHLALDSYMCRPDDPRRIAHVRHHLAIVHAATANEALPFAWREMHYACVLLLNADQWHPFFD